MYDLIDRCVDPAAGIYSPPPYVCIVRVCVCLCLAEGSLLALMTTIITLTHTMTSLPSQDEVGNGGENLKKIHAGDDRLDGRFLFHFL